MLINFLICFTIFFIAVYWPARRLRREYVRQDFRQTLLLFKLNAVRNYYDDLHGLSYLEIARRYDLEAAYQNIGRRPRR